MNLFFHTYHTGDLVVTDQNIEYIILEELSGNTYKCINKDLYDMLEYIKKHPRISIYDFGFCAYSIFDRNMDKDGLPYFDNRYSDQSVIKSILNNPNENMDENMNENISNCYKQLINPNNPFYVDIEKNRIKHIKKDNNEKPIKYTVTKKDTHTLEILTADENDIILGETYNKESGTKIDYPNEYKIIVKLDSNTYKYILDKPEKPELPKEPKKPEEPENIKPIRAKYPSDEQYKEALKIYTDIDELESGQCEWGEGDTPETIAWCEKVNNFENRDKIEEQYQNDLLDYNKDVEELDNKVFAYNNFIFYLKNIFDMYIDKVKYEINIQTNSLTSKSGGKKISKNTYKKTHTKRNKKTHTKRHKKTYRKRSKMRNKKVYKHTTLRK
jgi:hypothetical protein